MASPPNQGNLPWSNSQPLYGEPWQSQFTNPAGGSQSFLTGYSGAAGTSYDATQASTLNFGFSPAMLSNSFESSSLPSSFGGSQSISFNMSESHLPYSQPMAPPPPAPAPWLAAAAAASAPSTGPPAKKPRKTNPNPKPRKKAGEGTAGGAPKERKKPGPKPRAKQSASASDRRSRSISQSVAPTARPSLAPGTATGPTTTARAAADEEEQGDSEDEEEEDEALEDDELERQETIERERNEKLGALMRAMTEEQYDRHESYRRGGLNKMTVKKLVSHVLSQSVSTPVALLFAGAGKVFVGEIVESARKVAANRPTYTPGAPLTPDDLREAFMTYKREREQPGLYPPGAPSTGAGAAGTGKRKRLF